MIIGCREETPRALPSKPAATTTITAQPTTTRAHSEYPQSKPVASRQIERATSVPVPVITTTRAASAPSTQWEPLEPLAHARVGDRARYALRNDQRMSLLVTKTTATNVTIEVEMRIAGKLLPLPAVRVEPRDLNRPRQEAQRRDAHLTVTAESIDVAGRRWSARRIAATWTDEEIDYRQTTWLAADAPLYGILKMIQTADGEVSASMELLDFTTETRAAENPP
jgi:hypothetical protein